MTLKPTASPLRLHHDEVYTPDSAPRLQLRRVTWASRCIVTVLNVRQLLETLAAALSAGRTVPPVPQGLTVQMKISEYLRALEHKRTDPRARKWMHEHITRIVGSRTVAP